MRPILQGAGLRKFVVSADCPNAVPLPWVGKRTWSDNLPYKDVRLGLFSDALLNSPLSHSVFTGQPILVDAR